MSRSYLTDRERARKLAQEIAPSRVDAYFDKVQIWLKEKLPRSQQPEWLQKARRTHRAHKHDGAMRYHGDYVQRWQLRQPTRDELQWMSRLDGVLLNGVEVSLDWVLRYMDERDAAFGWLCRCHVMPGQRGDQQIRWVKGRVRYSGPQGAPNVLAMYADRRSRISGERFCVHLDWRINGVEALQRAGIRSVQDLLNFSHYGFWKKRLRCYEVDTKKLGRVYHERVLGKGRRRQWISRTNGVTYDYDSRAGYAIFRVNGKSQVQIVVDLYHDKFNVMDCLQEIKIPRRLLPKRILSEPIRTMKNPSRISHEKYVDRENSRILKAQRLRRGKSHVVDIGRCQKALQIRNGRGVYHTATAATAAGYRPSDALRSIAEMEFRAAFRNGDTKKMDELLSLDYYDGDPDERISHDDEVLDSWKA